MSFAGYLEASADLLRATAAHINPAQVEAAIARITEALGRNFPLLVCGNGGSAADAQHITGELVSRFLKDRRALNAICLSTNATVLTAWGNDIDFDLVFARQVEAHGARGGVLLGLSTSGKSRNVIAAFEAARAGGLATIALTGAGGGPLGQTADILLDVPSTSTPLIQQTHVAIYHFICEAVEARLVAT